MPCFAFQPGLFEARALVLDELAAHGFVWLEDFGSVDLDHASHGLEVCGIARHADARRILALLRRLFPAWGHSRVYYRRHSREDGWKVILAERDDGGGR